MKTEVIAQIIHDTNKMYCDAKGDLSQTFWADTPPDTQNSVINGIDFYLAHEDPDAEDMHNNWMEYRLKQGWKLGEQKSVFRKTHPNLVPFDKLPEEEQVKDKLFMALCEAFKHAE